jgi:hypothetical protein
MNMCKTALARSWSAWSCALRKRKQYVNWLGVLSTFQLSPIRLPDPHCCVPSYSGNDFWSVIYLRLSALATTVPLLFVLRTRRIVLGYDATDPYYHLDRDNQPLLSSRYKVIASNEDYIVLDITYSHSCIRVIQYFLEGTLTRILRNLAAPHGIGVSY